MVGRNTFDRMYRRSASPLLFRALADRDDDDEKKLITLHLPDGKTRKQQAIVGNFEVVDLPGQDGKTYRVETIEVAIELDPDCDFVGTAPAPFWTQTEITVRGKRYAVRQIIAASDNIVRFTLERSAIKEVAIRSLRSTT